MTIHESRRGRARATAAASVALLAFAMACASAAANDTSSRPTTSASGAAEVIPGVEVLLSDSIHLIRGKRVGLITNHSGFDRRHTATIDVLAAVPGTKLVALFAPEHGIRGVAETTVQNAVDEKTGLPIYSFYGETRKPTPEMLKDVDVLVYDIQDIGVRQYTFE